MGIKKLIVNTANMLITGSGNLDVSGSAMTQEIRLHGSGEFSSFNFHTSDATVNITGSADCEINVSKNLKATITGSGNVEYKGSPPSVNSRITGSGSLVPVK